MFNAEKLSCAEVVGGQTALDFINFLFFTRALWSCFIFEAAFTGLYLELHKHSVAQRGLVSAFRICLIVSAFDQRGVLLSIINFL